MVIDREELAIGYTKIRKLHMAWFDVHLFVNCQLYELL